MSEHIGNGGPTVFEATVLGKLERIEEDTQQLKRILTGNGEPEKGLVVRVDRIEQCEADRKWLVRAGVGSGIGAMLATLWQWIQGVHK